MLFLLSGEGPTDFGNCQMGLDPCEGAAFEQGPLAVVVASLAESILGYDPIDTGHFRLVTKATLKSVADELVPRKVRVPGRSRPRETGYFYTSARALAVIARRWADESKDDVVAVLFRDSDTSCGLCTREILCQRVRPVVGRLPAVTMPSFSAFRDRLVQVLHQCLSNGG